MPFDQNYSICWLKVFTEGMRKVNEAQSWVEDPRDQRPQYNLLQVHHPIFVGQRFHEVGLKEIVPLKFFKDRYEVEETFLVSEKPPDVHDPRKNLRIYQLFLSAETDEFFLWQTCCHILLDFFLN